MKNPFTDYVTVSDYQQFAGVGMRMTVPASSPEAWQFYQEVYSTWAGSHRLRKWDVSAQFDISNPQILSPDATFLNYVASPRSGIANQMLNEMDMQLIGEPIFDFSARALQELLERRKNPGRFHSKRTQVSTNTYLEQFKMADWTFRCVGMMNSPLNMALMPLVANMRGIRSGLNIADDGSIVFGSEVTRQDTFLYVLYKYYQGDDLLLRRAGADGEMLKMFLDQFRSDNNPYTSVRNFCNDVYLIRLSYRKLREIILDGSKPLRNEEDVFGYCSNAIEWWRVRAEAFADDIRAERLHAKTAR